MTVDIIMRELHPVFGLVTAVYVRYSNGRKVKRLYDHKISTKVPVSVENISS